MIKQRKKAGICWDEKGKVTQQGKQIELKEINQKVLAKVENLKRYRQYKNTD